MQYIITFLEGIISFISPCMLPMLPLYISYLGGRDEKNKGKTLLRATGFVLGFTIVFALLGLFAGTLGVILVKYQTIVNIVSGLLVIAFGLSYLEVIRLPFFKGMGDGMEVKGFFSAMLFGMVYSISLTPCVGAFLGSALMLASSAGGALKGTLLLVVYSLGLGVPFLLSAVLMDKLSAVFAFTKKHYKIINLISGGFLILVGILMALGLLNKVLAIFS